MCFCGCVDLCLYRDSGVLAHVPVAKLGQTPPCLDSVGSWVQHLRVCVHACLRESEVLGGWFLSGCDPWVLVCV